MHNYEVYMHSFQKEDLKSQILQPAAYARPKYQPKTGLIEPVFFPN